MSQSTKHVVDRFLRAMNDHDLDELISCFHEDYRSETPAHPERSFTGRAQVRANWVQLFETTPDLAVEFSRTMIDDDTAWIELRMHGTQTDEELDVRGVVIKGISGDRIQWGRIYLEPVQQSADVTWEAIYAGQEDG
ncbi:nuclear transport factor 2 family protein [Natronorubrum texcoconense]|uniref:SnoaL-like domain-containing protein n=1 Tax=Natronorubrum texcoconense TaxID=1095776 RepID=A0A1G8UY15_9EURY|nr:nuclear transport factor 2 family protein [Natronorubrum texcoconense]SDJ57985.1 SnoaL-like domain-containing protein [Natronorubrum texcoconense]